MNYEWELMRENIKKAIHEARSNETEFSDDAYTNYILDLIKEFNKK